MEYDLWKYLCSLDNVLKVETQVKCQLIPSFSKYGLKYQGITHIPDFLVTFKTGQLYVDAKGFLTPTCLLKRKLFNYIYKTDILVWIIGLKRVNGHYTEWCDYFENEKDRKLRKKEKLIGSTKTKEGTIKRSKAKRTK